jgi:hypothetical protein
MSAALRLQPLLRTSILKRSIPQTSNLLGSSRSYSFDSIMRGGNSNSNYEDIWPIQSQNTILNIVPQGERHIVERMGEFHSCRQSGFFFAIPFIDQIRYVIDMRERAIPVAPQAAITKDNVSVDVSGNIYIQFIDPEKSAYGSSNPLMKIMIMMMLWTLITPTT